MTVEDELTTAAAKGHMAEVETLLLKGAPVNGVNCFGRTALQVVMMGSSPVAQLLLTHGADPNVADRSTRATPLHDAARAGFLDTVRLLVEAGADPQARDNSNRLPVDLARQNDHTDVVAFLKTL
ncbi:hypothetical protein CHARACLAT_020774 [Characodon lateralis]|uniref:Cyclin-dependent kinase inhibitor 2A/B (p15, inhibits CDK4) n=1 Tax=Characodon lateralis TaxID=208331 RepID=A0ABU7D8N8_9TELE|nr:hypothetical protein [Characodon lateralis]